MQQNPITTAIKLATLQQNGWWYPFYGGITSTIPVNQRICDCGSLF